MSQKFMIGDLVKVKDNVSRWKGAKGIVIKHLGILYVVRINGVDLEFHENELYLISTFDERFNGDK